MQLMIRSLIKAFVLFLNILRKDTALLSKSLCHGIKMNLNLIIVKVECCSPIVGHVVRSANSI